MCHYLHRRETRPSFYTPGLFGVWHERKNIDTSLSSSRPFEASTKPLLQTQLSSPASACQLCFCLFAHLPKRPSSTRIMVSLNMFSMELLPIDHDFAKHYPSISAFIFARTHGQLKSALHEKSTLIQMYLVLKSQIHRVEVWSFRAVPHPLKYAHTRSKINTTRAT